VRDAYATGGRQITVDILRGFFILSMASGHVGAGLITSLLHVWRWVDGACGFVLLSAFVLGLSQRAKWDRGQSTAQNWILRRTAQIWAIGLALNLAGMALRLADPELVFIPDIFHRGRILEAIGEIATLQLWVNYFGMLRMYVYFLAFAWLAVSLLKRNLDLVVLVASSVLYLLVQVNTLDPGLGWGAEPYLLGKFSVPAWQFLFFTGLVFGWRWKESVEPLATRWQHGIAGVSALGVLGFLWLAHGYKIAALERVHPGDLTPWFDKFNLSPPVVIYFICLLGVLPALIAAARRLHPMDRVLRVVALIGRHSLACYVILCLTQGAMWLAADPAPADEHGAKHWAWFAVVSLLFVLYSYGMEARVQRRPAPAAAPRSADPQPV